MRVHPILGPGRERWDCRDDTLLHVCGTHLSQPKQHLSGLSRLVDGCNSWYFDGGDVTSVPRV